MSNFTNKNWWKASIERALRTMAQTAVATIGTSAFISAVDWKMVVSASLLAGILSLLTSIGGLPEVNNIPVLENTNKKDEKENKQEEQIEQEEIVEPVDLPRDFEEVEDPVNAHSVLENFIMDIYPLIKSKVLENGYNESASIAIVAQAVTESYKKDKKQLSILASKYHNYFGMKCGSSWKGNSVNLKTNEEYTPGTITTIKDNFRTYSSMEEGITGYFEFIKYKRYANLKEATSAEQYAEFLKKDMWATSSVYVESVCNNIKYVKSILNM